MVALLYDPSYRYYDVEFVKSLTIKLTLVSNFCYLLVQNESLLKHNQLQLTIEYCNTEKYEFD